MKSHFLKKIARHIEKVAGLCIKALRDMYWEVQYVNTI